MPYTHFTFYIVHFTLYIILILYLCNMKQNKAIKKIAKWISIAVVTPIVLFLVLAIMLYIPPIQNFAVHRVATYLSEKMEMQISINKVRLAFPLDLAVHRMTAIEKGDTLIHANHVRLNVKLLPLFQGRADIEGVEVYGLKLDTKSYISDTHIVGTAEELTASAHGVDWQKEIVNVNHVKLRNADVNVVLSDTAQKDTTQSKAKWNIGVAKADIENSKVHLQMPGDSMRIFANIGKAALRGGIFDIGKNYYAVKRFNLQRSAANYDLHYIPPVSGMDVNHLALTHLSARIDTLSYNADGVLRVGVRNLTLKEKCGLHVTHLLGSIYMDSTQLRVPKLQLHTTASRIHAAVAFNFCALRANKGGHCQAKLDAEIGYKDIANLSVGYVDKKYLRVFTHQPLIVKSEVSGNIDHLRMGKLTVNLPGVAHLSANGHINYALNNWRNARFNFNLRTQHMAAVQQLLPKRVQQTLHIPNGIAARGSVTLNGNNYAANLNATCGKGALAAKAKINTQSQAYQLQARANRFPIAHIVRGIPVGPFSGSIQATGRHFDVLSAYATLRANLRAEALQYDRYDLSGLHLEANLHGGRAWADINMNNPLLQMNGNLEALIHAHAYDAKLNLSIPHINLQRLGLITDTLALGTDLDLHFKTNQKLTAYSLNGSLRNNHIITPKIHAQAKDIYLDFGTNRDTTTAMLSAGDLYLNLGAKGDVPYLTRHITHFATELNKELQSYNLDQEKLKTILPHINLKLRAGQDNPLYNLAHLKGYTFNSAYVDLCANPTIGMTGDARMGSIQVGALLLDTVDMHIFQDSTGVQMAGWVKNNRKNPNPLEVRLKSYLMKAGAGACLSYYDRTGRCGVNLGLQASLQDHGINITLSPHNPVLAYRKFTMNPNNYVFIDKNNFVRANLNLLADDGTGLKIYGEPKDSVNDITVSVNQLNLNELTTAMPYMPNLSGMLSGDIHVTEDHNTQQLSAMASLQADGFKYEDTPLGNIGIDALYLPKTGGEHHASVFINSNNEEVLVCNGTYFDRDGGMFKGDAQLHDFPLQLLNGFMSGTDVALKGIAGGELALSGSISKPEINGSLDLDSTHIYSDVYGFDFLTDERALKIENSRLIFDNYNLYSTGKNPLVLNGVFDMSNFEHMRMDFTMKANNFELINTRKKAKSMVFGKVYANYNGTLKGTTNDLAIKGKLEVLDRTDVTYVLKDSPLSVDDRLHDLVQFTDFNDSTNIHEKIVAPTTGVDITLGISISDAAIFHCNLSEDGQSYVKLEGGGNLTLRLTQQGEMRMTGRFTTNSGEMKYQLPIIPLKTFQLVQGSYVEFTGDVMNPTLNIAAKERTKAVVTENDRQRSVAFDVGVKITQPLNNMGLEFTIEAPEDLNIQNQLATMSTEQRGKTAVTLMATGMYMTDETMLSGSGFQANNALNAFLQSEIQNIAGSALKTIDINLGVESGTSNLGTSTTDYSFQFAKRFWGNRISVIIGGKVSTGSDAQNSAESFINNVSVEYRLDQGATRYVKVFYDRNTQDPLEGQLTKTGVGLVLRRKTDRLGELFIFKKRARALKKQ